MHNLIGQTIGQYRIIEQIGRGGMATVYKAFQPSMERYVAIKVLPDLMAQDPTFIERFRQEAKAIAQLEHPYILPVYDYGEDHGLTYMVMRYMDSGTLTARLRKQPELAEIVRLLVQVAEALDYTHSRGIVHRDIKPANVLIDSRGETLLTDFGIAKMVEGTQGLTQGAIVGTPAYMSPEQAQGQPVDGRSDIYSLGIILYEALVGRPPFEAETPVAVLMKHVNAPLPLPRTVKPEISQAMEQVILKALAKVPADRYQTASELARAMQAALTSAGQGLTQVSPKPTTGPRLTQVSPGPAATSPVAPSPVTIQNRKNSRLSGQGLGLIALLCLILISAGVGIYYWLRPAPSLATWQFVIDASSGMSQTINGQAKIDIARAALDKELRILPNNVNAGLRIFGGAESNLEPCRDTKLLVQPVSGQSERITSALAGVTPQGQAPLTEAIVQAISDFDLSQDTKNSLIIITAGLDTCEAEAVDQLQTLSRRLGIEVDLHLIGLGVQEETDRTELAQLAQAAGGDYYDASNEEEVGQVLRDQISVVQGTPVAARTSTPTPTSPPAATITPLPATPIPQAFDLAEPVNLSNSPNNSSQMAQIKLDGAGNLHLFWVDQATGGSDFNLLHRYQPPNGSWSDPKILSADFKSLIPSSPRLARNPEGQVCLFFAAVGPAEVAQKLYSGCFLGETQTEITLAQEQWRDVEPAFTPDGAPVLPYNVPPGAIYLAETELSAGGNGLAYQPTFAVDQAGNYHIAWVRQSDPQQLEYRFSGDGGQSWSEIEKLSQDGPATLSRPQLVADSQGNVHLAWNSFGGVNFYRRWTPAAGWGETVKFTQDQMSGSSWYTLDIGPDDLPQIAWLQSSLYYTRQQPDGRWTQPVVLLEQVGENSLGARMLAIDPSGSPHFVWIGSDKDVYYTTVD